MKVPVSWLREFVDVPSDPRVVAARLAACGFAAESVDGDVIDFEVTANRPDCLSVYGLAREAAAAFDLALKAGPTGATGSAGAADPALPISIEHDACGRYGLALADVTVGPSPAWLAARLTAAGTRPINNIVDITNYVMLEMGQPMHAFDVAKLAGPAIHVRLARAGEKLTTLDGEARSLDDRMLVIADRDRAVAVAGVMGGRASEVSGTTTRIAIESAWFEPTSVRATSKRLGLKTEASARFERGADLDAPVRAIARVVTLLTESGAGRLSGAIADVHPRPVVARFVRLKRSHAERLLGTAIPDADVQRILTKLGFTVVGVADGWQVRVPSFRVDVSREADLIEEIARHWGFDRIPAALPPLTTLAPPRPFGGTPGHRLRRLLSGAGLQEAATFSFIERAAAEPFVAPGALVAIANPLSEKFAVMRPSLLPGLVAALIYNRHREANDVRLFEVGSVFTPARELEKVGWVLTGARGGHWSGNGGAVDFFDAKGVAEMVARAFVFEITFTQADDLPWFVRGRAARLMKTGSLPLTEIGQIGEIRPDLLAARGLHAGAVFAGEINANPGDPFVPVAAEGARGPQVKPLPRYPSIVRDVSIVVPDRLPAAEVRGTIHAHAPATLVRVREFDRYQGKGVPAGQVSLSVRLTFQSADRTLTDAEVQQAVDVIVAALAREHGAVLRGATTT